MGEPLSLLQVLPLASKALVGIPGLRIRDTLCRFQELLPLERIRERLPAIFPSIAFRSRWLAKPTGVSFLTS